jgi:hypothetical protein
VLPLDPMADESESPRPGSAGPTGTSEVNVEPREARHDERGALDNHVRKLLGALQKFLRERGQTALVILSPEDCPNALCDALVLLTYSHAKRTIDTTKVTGLSSICVSKACAPLMVTFKPSSTTLFQRTIKKFSDT